jgi:hypothetical protein
MSAKAKGLFETKLSQLELLKFQVLCDAKEYDELPVRHNEDLMNKELSKDCPIPLADSMMDQPSTKAHLLLQCHFGHLQLPCSDYFTDTKSVLDQAIRILQVGCYFYSAGQGVC